MRLHICIIFVFVLQYLNEVQMRRTVEIKDETWARSKAAAALSGLTVADFVGVALDRAIRDGVGGGLPTVAAKPTKPTGKPKAVPAPAPDDDLPFVTRKR